MASPLAQHAAVPPLVTSAAAQRGHAVPAYQAERVTDLEAFLARCDRLANGRTLPFHHSGWLRAWYQTLGREAGREPLLLAVRLQPGGPDAALLPLVITRQAGLRVVSFADAGVVDYTGPLLAEHWRGAVPQTAAAPALWLAIRQGLQGAADVLRIEKMLGRQLDAEGEPVNPLMQVLPLHECEWFGNQFSAPEGWEAWRRSLDKTVRKEIERCWRVFQRSPGARFERVTDPAAAHALFNTLEQQQSERMHALGLPYVLDRPAYRAFYRQLIDSGLAGGNVVLTVLRDGDAVVSAMFGIASGTRFVALRQSIGGPQWKNASPGRLLDDGTAEHLHGQGLTQFDFGIGDYHHKSALKMVRIPLFDTCVALSARGAPMVAAWHARRWLKDQPRLRALWLDRIKPRLRPGAA